MMATRTGWLMVLTVSLLGAQLFANTPAEQTVATLLLHAKETGNLEQTKKLAVYYATHAAEKDRRLFKGLVKKLDDGSWTEVLAEARQQTEVAGFTFTISENVDVISRFVQEILRGLSPKTLKAKQQLATEYASLFPDVTLFRFLRDRLGEIRKDDTKRRSLLAKSNAIMNELKKKGHRQVDMSGNPVDARRRQIRQSSHQRQKLANEAEARKQERYRALDAQTEAAGLVPASKQLSKLVTEVKARLKKAEVTGKY